MTTGRRRTRCNTQRTTEAGGPWGRAQEEAQQVRGGTLKVGASCAETNTVSPLRSLLNDHLI